MKFFTRLRKTLFPFIIFLVMFQMSCEYNPTNVIDDNKAVNGTLIDEQGTPVPYAILEVNNSLPGVLALLAKDTTDEDGNFTLPKLSGDVNAMNIKIIHQDFKNTEMKFSEFKTKSKVPVSILHQDTCTGFIGIHTYNNTDSSQLDDVEVRLFRDGNLIRKSLTKHGVLTFAYICPGDYIMRLFKHGYGLIYDSVHVEGSDSIPFSFYMISSLEDSCCHGKLTITVKDSANNNPLNEVMTILYLGGNKIAYGKTDSSGIITFTGLCPGDYSTSLSKSGFINSYIHNIHLDCNDTVDASGTMSKAPKTDTCCTAAIIGRVVGKDSSAIAGATFYIFRTGGETITGTSDSTGHFRVYNLCAPVSYTVKAMKDGYNFQYLTVNFTKCDTQYVTLMLTPSGSDSCCNGIIYVSLKDSATGNPITSGVSYLYKGSSKIASAHIDSSGYVVFTKVCPGDYAINFSVTGYNNKSIYNIHMDCNDSASYQHQLAKSKGGSDTCCTAAIITRVMKSDSSAISGATVYIFKSGGETITGTTDANGIFKAYNLCAPGSYTIKAMKDGYNYNYVSLSFTKCDTQYVHVVLTPSSSDSCCNGIIYVSLKDSATGNPITSGVSYLYKGSSKIASAHIDSSGYVVFTKVCPGDYAINFSVTGYNNKSIYNIHMDCNDTASYQHQLAKSKGGSDTCCTAAIITRVMKSDSSAISGATVYIFKSGGETITGTTDAYGIFKAYNLCAPGSYTIKAMKDGYNYNYVSLSFTKCDTQYVHVVLTPTASDTCCKGIIYVSLKDSATGEPITSGYSYLYKGSSKVATAHIDSNGYVIFTKVCPGDYAINFSVTGYNNKSIYNIKMDCNDTATYQHYLSKTKGIDTCCTAVISVHVFDSSDSTALQGAIIYIYKDNQQIVNDSTDSQGNYAKHYLCAPGTYTVKVMKSGYQHQYFTINFKDCKTEYLYVGLVKQ